MVDFIQVSGNVSGPYKYKKIKDFNNGFVTGFYHFVGNIIMIMNFVDI